MTSENNSQNDSKVPHPRPVDANSSPLPSDQSGFRAIDPQVASRRRREAKSSLPSVAPSNGPHPATPSSKTTPPIDRASVDRAPQSPAQVTGATTASPTPSQVLPPQPSPQPTFPQQTFPEWRNAPRADRWQQPPAPDLGRFQQAQLITFLAVPLLPLGLHALWYVTNYYWARFATSVLRWRMPVPQYQFPVPGCFQPLARWADHAYNMPEFLLGLSQVLDTVVLAVITFWAAPYGLRYLLQWVYKAQPWSIARLGQVSAEAQKCVQTACQQRRLPLPQFALLPTSAPLILPMGHRAKMPALF